MQAAKVIEKCCYLQYRTQPTELKRTHTHPSEENKDRLCLQRKQTTNKPIDFQSDDRHLRSKQKFFEFTKKKKFKKNPSTDNFAYEFRKHSIQM